ncbi:hypothetical protein ACN0IV_10035 [Trabulsiella odontotermitis]|uniref:hypothetical protein n=1 Tax=Trabulsiella odontotermitis TaxID=379893 RepID=UPI003AC551E2
MKLKKGRAALAFILASRGWETRPFLFRQMTPGVYHFLPQTLSNSAREGNFLRTIAQTSGCRASPFTV